MDVAQSAPFIQSITYEAGIIDYQEFPPRTEEPVWILGKQYSALHDRDDIDVDIKSRLWLTYRKGFSPIGGTGPINDCGWGCMLRCGQMMLAQALINRHVGRDWRWTPGKYDPKYYEILRMFLDKKGSTYSIHQIASMGMSEGKMVGEWFGPNTIAQVLKKLVVYDDWSNLVLHVAMDNTVIIDDIRSQCLVEKKNPPQDPCSQCTCEGSGNTDKRQGPVPAPARSSACNGDHYHNEATPSISSGTCEACIAARTNWSRDLPGDRSCVKSHDWRPLLLVIPLRLGLTEMNSVYIAALKTCLTFRQSVGIIGGKPNHAHWFIGFVDNQIAYLDPHTTQPFADITQNESDESYHCQYLSSMDIMNLDPSIALGFYCGSEAEFEDLLRSIQKFIIAGERTPMFELNKKRPRHWPPFQPYSPDGAAASIEFTLIEDRQFDTSDEEFELL